jgi:hypothetical protein
LNPLKKAVSFALPPYENSVSQAGDIACNRALLQELQR